MASNVPVLPAGSAATAPRDGGRGGGRDGARGQDDDDVGGDKRRTEVKRQRRQEREKHAVVLDELAPKETGRQAVAVRKARESKCGCFFGFIRLPVRGAAVLNRGTVRCVALFAPSTRSP